MPEPLDLEALRRRNSVVADIEDVAALIAELEATRIERDNQLAFARTHWTRAERAEAELKWMTEHSDLKMSPILEEKQRADSAEAERNRLMKLISVRETDWEANKAAIARVEAYCEDSSLWRDITVAGVLAALRGDQ